MEHSFLILLLYAAGGVLISSLLAIVPALHIYNVVAIFLFTLGALAGIVPQDVLPFFLIGMMSGYVVLNTIPSIFLSAPDESMIFVVLPTQKMVDQGRGYEASVVTGFGSVLGAIFIVAITPLAIHFLPTVKRLLMPHLFWILGAVSVYLLMSEWPKSHDRGKTGWQRFKQAWKGLLAGIATFFAAGILGFIIFTRNPMPPERSFQSLLPVFVGLFAVPWVLMNIFSKRKIPKQHISRSLDMSLSSNIMSMAAGGFGGLLASTFPILTAGVGGLLAGQAVAAKDNRVFVASQGVSKTVYYVGAFLFFLLPGAGLGKGGRVAMMRPFYMPTHPREFFLGLAVLIFAIFLGFMLLFVYTRFMIWLLSKVSFQLLSFITLFILIGIVYGMTGLFGILTCTAATAIGLMPPLFGSRRLNCMGALLFPVTINMAGLGPKLARLMGL